MLVHGCIHGYDYVGTRVYFGLHRLFQHQYTVHYKPCIPAFIHVIDSVKKRFSLMLFSQNTRKQVYLCRFTGVFVLIDGCNCVDKRLYLC